MNKKIGFLVEDAPEGGYVARAIGESIVTEADDTAGLHSPVRDAVQCHFEDGKAPKLIRLHLVRGKMIAA